MYYPPPETGKWTRLLFWSCGNQESCNQGFAPTVLCLEHPGEILFSFHDLVHACKLLACGSLPSTSLLTPLLCPVFLCHACLLPLLCALNVLLLIMFLMDSWITLNSILIATHPNCSQLQSSSVMWALCFYVLNEGMNLLFWEKDRWWLYIIEGRKVLNGELYIPLYPYIKVKMFLSIILDVVVNENSTG